MKKDGHRPVSEKFRRISDELLIQSLEELRIPYHILGGSISDRLEKIIGIFDLPLIVPIEEAIARAEAKVQADIAVLENDARFHEAQRQKSLRRRLSYALRY